MTWQWNTGFENTPDGNDFGSICCVALRSYKGGFKERMSPEHVFDETATPKCYHRAGLCTVVEIVEGTPASNLVAGALQYSPTGGFKRDTGSAMEAMGPSDHLALIGTEDVEADHPQYVPLTPSAGYVTITGDINLASSYKVTGLPSALGGGEANEEVLSRGMHLGAAVAGGAKHDNGIVTLADTFSDAVKLGLEKLKHTERNQSFAPGNIALEDYASFPVLDPAGGAMSTKIYGQTATDSNDYVGRINIQDLVGAQTLRWIRFDA